MEYKLDDALSELGFTLRGDGSFKSGCEIVFSLTQGEDEAETRKSSTGSKFALPRERSSS